MTKPIIAALVAGQLMSAAQPALAADLAATGEQRAGAFAGLRLSVPLDGAARERPVRLGLALAPTLRSRNGEGEIRTRIGEGMEFGYRSNRPLSFSLAGRDLSRLGAAQGDDSGGGVPTWALIVGGVAVTLGLAYWGFSEAIDCDAEEECS